MEAFRGSPVANSRCAARSFSAHSISSSYQWRSTFGTGGDVSLFFLKLPSFRPQAGPGSRRLRVSSRLVSHHRRRNALREKLLARQDQVRTLLEEVTAPQLLSEDAQPGGNLHSGRQPCEGNAGAADADYIHGGPPLTLVRDVEKDVTTEDSLAGQELSSKSVLWNKLENWVEQYKKDSELWGIGAVPIFTIYKDSDGNVTRVSLNEDEIIRRTRVKSWPLQPKEYRDDSMDVNGKISHAKLIAKGIESGEYKPPMNSIVAKIVVEGDKSSLSIPRLFSLTCDGRTLFMLSHKVLFGFLFGCFVFWSLKKLLFTNDTTELTREEKEMLRRKLKSRKERSTVEKGSVQILKNIPELPMGTVQRPPLDKNELMKNIKAKASAEGSTISNMGSHFGVTENFKERVREIREMVKQVHELEEKDQQDVDKRGSESDVYLLPTAKDELPAMNSNANLETHSMVIGSACSDIPDDTVLATGAVNMNFAGVMEDSPVTSPKNVPFGDSGKKNSLDESVESEVSGAPIIGTLGCVNEMPVEVFVDRSNPEDGSSIQSMDVLRNEEMEQGVNKGKDVDSSIPRDREGMPFDVTCSDNRIPRDREGMPFGVTCSDNPSPVRKNSIHMKPKIIVSVKEAKEYLHRGCVSSTDKLEFNKKMQEKCQPVVNGSPNSMNKRMNVAKSPNLEIMECAKDNTHAQDSSSRMDLHHVPKATDQRNTYDPSCTAAATSLSSVDVETGERGCMNGTSPDRAEDKTLRKEDTASVRQPFKKEEVSALKETDCAKNLYKPNSSDLTDEEHDCQQQEVKSSEVYDDINGIIAGELSLNNSRTASGKNKILAVSSPGLTSVPMSIVGSSADREIEEDCDDGDHEILRKATNYVDLSLRPSTTCDEAALQGDSLELKHGMCSLSDSNADFSQGSNGDNCHTEVKQIQGEKSWIEQNFQQFDPIIQKIGVGFKENYMSAREKVKEQKMLSAEMGEMALEDGELEWMNDDNLREVVFKVRENELAGREPFHLMDADEQYAFFKGLERKAEKENKKMLALHELIHSKIENIDYGMDGISLDDPLEKIMPRWKGPPISEDPEFLNNFARQRQVIFEHKMETSSAANEDTEDSRQKALSPSSPNQNLGKPSRNAASVNPKTVIECSDGSSRAGKNLGKEHWEHTKKWSREFLELYNAETDPEVKSIMRDMGKDLDKWITEKEIQDVADLMTRIPKRKRRYIEKKLDKLKREIEMFGHQAVVSKYREYSEETEEDYLWWLDLSFILCIELYRTEDNVPKVGFYSLEMAADLELNPKQYHVIAFEDPGDSKSFCYIIQAHMEMLGNGNAFVVARPPKDAFREARANGFNVTVIRKGELKLNIDQTLEEVEEEIIEIGSKMYHDKIMCERSIDMGALMKGIFSANKSSKRKPKRVLKKPTVS